MGFDLFFWRSQGNPEAPAEPEPEVVPYGNAVYRIAGIWRRDYDGNLTPDYDAKFRIEVAQGTFFQHDKIVCDEALAKVLSKRFVLIPIMEKP